MGKIEPVWELESRVEIGFSFGLLISKIQSEFWSDPDLDASFDFFPFQGAKQGLN